MHLPEDRTTCEELLRTAWERGDRAKLLPELVVEVGERFLGAPYEVATLEREGQEQLVVNLRAFDCVTFVENAIVLANLIRAGKRNFADYLAVLERIRYRRGRRDGYASRLHYFTDWLYDGARKGIVRDVTAAIGGIPFPKRFHALTDRRAANPALADRAVFHRLRCTEGTCSRRPLFFIPEAALPANENRIAEGDIIAIATDDAGIDVCHAGLAVRRGERVRLLHASSRAGRIILSEASLADYLAERRSRTGIIVGRVITGEA
ncbi:MAG: N-acetylmuramoyl-L-alanine amidase-like domain-containing protein [Syntrophales bacterium]